MKLELFYISNFFSVHLEVIMRHNRTSYMYGISVCEKQQINKLLNI